MFARENLQIQFQITSDHVATTLVNLAQRHIKDLESHMPKFTDRQMILMEIIKEFKIDSEVAQSHCVELTVGKYNIYLMPLQRSKLKCKTHLTLKSIQKSINI